MKTFLLSLLTFLSFAASASAAVVASFSGAYDARKPVHVLVAGYAHGMGLQFVEAAVAQGRRYQELYPDHEVVLIRNNEKGTAADATQLEALGLKVIAHTTAPETGAFVVRVAASFAAIASLEFFSHSSIHSGAGLEGDGIGVATITLKRFDCARVEPKPSSPEDEVKVSYSCSYEQ